MHVLIKELGNKGIETLNGNEDSMIDAFHAMIDKQIELTKDPNLKHRNGNVGRININANIK